jgi:lactobin A/cerein 7B family class IIb bacteriocin
LHSDTFRDVASRYHQEVSVTQSKQANETPGAVPDSLLKAGKEQTELSEEELKKVSGGATNIPVVSQIGASISIVTSFVGGFFK